MIVKKIIISSFGGLIVLVIILFFLFSKSIKVLDFSKYTINDIKAYAHKHKLILDIKKEYSNIIDKDKVIDQLPKPYHNVDVNRKITIIFSLGPQTNLYQDNKVNELGYVPLMMYHGIVDIDNNKYIGGNVDKDGYNRTKKAFISDLEMYYQKGYRMIKLIDYINGKIETEMGKSPLVLTFDDGNINNIKVIGKDDKGELTIDPNSAVGILESFKKKYKDYHVTATFFLNGTLFNQPKYDYDILKWLVKHGYDIGNHTKDHVDFTNIDTYKTQYEVAYMYELFDKIIPNQYQHLISLPFGSPYNKDHLNFNYILKGNYNSYQYETVSTLRVGWDANPSPFDLNFDKTFMKRIRAWDNNGKEFDITMCFNNLEQNRYISDGDSKTIVIKDDHLLNNNIKKMKIIKY